jgi:hypothetical protein
MQPLLVVFTSTKPWTPPGAICHGLARRRASLHRADGHLTGSNGPQLAGTYGQAGSGELRILPVPGFPLADGSPSMDRAERRRQERAERKGAVLIAGDGVVAQSVGQVFEAVPHIELPDKRPGKHRWIASACYVVADSAIEGTLDPDTPSFLDQENLFFLGVGCWDCEQPLTQELIDTPCRATAKDD